MVGVILHTARAASDLYLDATVVGKEEPSVSSSSSPSTTQNAKKYAYCAVIWGANLGYTLGALVLGQQLKNLKSEHVFENNLTNQKL